MSTESNAAQSFGAKWIPDRLSLLRETLLFDWTQWNPTVAWRSTPAMAIALATGIALGSPRAGLVAAAGAFTAGLGSLQRIRGSCLLPMLLAAVGMSVATFLGMLVGHERVLFVVLAGIWAATYALLTAGRGGTSWVAQQWTVWFLVSSAFHTNASGALKRCALILAGGLFQTVLLWALVRWSERGCAGEEVPRGPGLRQSVGSLGQCLRLRTPVCLYSLRMALVVMIAAEVYRHVNFLSGYWIPMTTLLVVRSDLVQTMTRGVMRVAGTLLGAGVAGLIATHLHPSPAVLAGLIVFFAWWAYSVLRVNYSLFTLNLTAYVVFLLSLSGLPPAEVVHRRAAYTALGGVLALLAYVDVFRKTRTWIRADRNEDGLKQAA
ncbi:MAG TPA: FUSC family protein [Acidobacteriaceae bacterium]